MTVTEISERSTFGNKVQYLLACIGFAVGLGNVWRFPKVCLDNGGGAFLIPYFIVFFVEGLPLMIIELLIGQRFRSSPAHCFGRMSRFAWGIGVSMAFASLYTSLYYNSVLSYGFLYFFSSFSPNLPWSSCPNDASDCGNSTSPSTYYLKNVLQNKAQDFDEPIDVQWHLYFATTFAWILVLMCMLNGVKSLGKVVYFTAVFPYVVLILILIIGLPLKGASFGVTYLLTPSFSEILNSHVWLAACEQIFFSASLGFGGLIVMSSHMPLKNNVLLDSCIIMGVNSATSLLAAVGIFSIKGHMAYRSYSSCQATNTCGNATMETFINENKGGTGLVFIAMADAVSVLGSKGVSLFISMMFYLMIICLGIDSSFGCLEGYLSLIQELAVSKFRSYSRKVVERLCLISVCTLSAIIAVIFCTNHGDRWIEIFDQYGSVYVLVVVGFCEYVVVSYIYGMHNFAKDFYMIVGFKPPIVLQFLWAYLSPTLLFVTGLGKMISDISLETLLTYRTSTNKINQYPISVVVICIFLFLSGILWIPIGAIFSMIWKLNWGSANVDVEKETESLPQFSLNSLEGKFFSKGLSKTEPTIYEVEGVHNPDLNVSCEHL